LVDASCWQLLLLFEQAASFIEYLLGYKGKARKRRKWWLLLEVIVVNEWKSRAKGVVALYSVGSPSIGITTPM